MLKKTIILLGKKTLVQVLKLQGACSLNIHLPVYAKDADYSY